MDRSSTYRHHIRKPTSASTESPSATQTANRVSPRRVGSFATCPMMNSRPSWVARAARSGAHRAAECRLAYTRFGRGWLLYRWHQAGTVAGPQRVHSRHLSVPGFQLVTQTGQADLHYSRKSKGGRMRGEQVAASFMAQLAHAVQSDAARVKPWTDNGDDCGSGNALRNAVVKLDPLARWSTSSMDRMTIRSADTPIYGRCSVFRSQALTCRGNLCRHHSRFLRGGGTPAARSVEVFG
jgi:hypothetical protein